MTSKTSSPPPRRNCSIGSAYDTSSTRGPELLDLIAHWMHDPCVSSVVGGKVWLQVDPAGAAHLELVSGVVQLRPEDAVLRRCCAAGVPSR